MYRLTYTILAGAVNVYSPKQNITDLSRILMKHYLR